MNKYFKIFLTVAVLTASGFLLTLGYYFLRMADSMFNAGGVLLLTATALGVYWCLHQLWIKHIPKDAKLFQKEEARAEGSQPDNVITLDGKSVIIENWMQYGDYMLFSNFVDKTGEAIILESTRTKIIARGKELALNKFCALLTEKEIKFTRN